MADEKASVEGVSSSNRGFQNASALQVRLDTSAVLQDIENFLRGREENFYRDVETQRTISKLDDVTKPKANSQGIQGILNYCRSLINPQVVQGNYEKKDWVEFIVEKREELAERLIVNMYNWELISEDTINEITDFIMNLAEPFLSRMIDNAERESYIESLKSTENTHVQGGSGGLSGMFGGNK